MLHQLLHLHRPLILFDLETTRKEQRIVQLGMMVFYADKEPTSYKSLVNPCMSIDNPEDHGINDAMIRDCCARCKEPKQAHPTSDCQEWKLIPKFIHIAESLYRGFQNADFCGKNVRKFDLPVIATEFARCGLNFEYWKTSVVDAERIEQMLEPRKLADLYRKYTGKEHVDAHDAMADVFATLEVLIGQFRDHARSATLPRTPQAIHEYCFPRDPDQIDSEGKFKFIDGVPCFNFGKHKDRPMRAATDYLRWMIGGSFTPEVKRICEDALSGLYPEQTKS